jgi:protein TorT
MKNRISLILLALLLSIGLVAVVTARAASESASASRRVTVKQYWEMYGKNVKGDWILNYGDDWSWFKPHPSQKYHFGATLPHIKDPYWVAVAYGLQVGAKELGATIDFRAASAYGDLEGQTRQIEDFVVKGEDAIAIGAVDTAGMTPVVRDVWNKGIFVCSDSVRTENPWTPIVGQNHYKGGYMIGDAYGQRWPKGKVVVLKGPAGAEWAEEATKGIYDALAKYPGIEILASKYNDMNREEIMNLATDYLTKWPDISAFVNYTDYQAKGEIAALRAAGYKPGQVKTMGNPINPESLQLMKEGWFTMALASSTVEIGRVNVWAMVNMLEGNPVPRFLTLPWYVVTLDNLPKYEGKFLGYEWGPEGWLPPAVMK